MGNSRSCPSPQPRHSLGGRTPVPGRLHSHGAVSQGQWANEMRISVSGSFKQVAVAHWPRWHYVRTARFGGILDGKELSVCISYGDTLPCTGWGRLHSSRLGWVLGYRTERLLSLKELWQYDNSKGMCFSANWRMNWQGRETSHFISSNDRHTLQKSCGRRTLSAFLEVGVGVGGWDSVYVDSGQTHLLP